MSWQETVSPTTTLLLLFIASLNIYLVLVSFQGGEMRREQLSHMTVSLNGDVTDSTDFRVLQGDDMTGNSKSAENKLTPGNRENLASGVKKTVMSAGSKEVKIENSVEGIKKPTVENARDTGRSNSNGVKVVKQDSLPSMNQAENYIRTHVDNSKDTGDSGSDKKALDKENVEIQQGEKTKTNQEGGNEVDEIEDTLNKFKALQQARENEQERGGELTEKKERTVVLLVSDYRSGSSLLGEMFNQNDNVYYLFEPLIGVVAPSAQRRFLEGLLECTPKHWGILRRSRQSGCGEYEDSDEYWDCLKSVNSTEECVKYEITAAKFIRLHRLSSVREFGVLDRDNVFVVHSFRDPRGTINSRLAYDVVHYNGEKIPRSSVTEEIVGEIAESLCGRYYNDSVFGDSLNNKYIRITYEDVCIDPETNIRRVYDTIGHTVPQRVLDWFSEHTHARSTSAQNDKMGLERNSALTAVRWREELPREFICAIERNCKQLLDYLNLEYTCGGS